MARRSKHLTALAVFALTAGALLSGCGAAVHPATPVAAAGVPSGTSSSGALMGTATIPATGTATAAGQATASTGATSRAPGSTATPSSPGAPLPAASRTAPTPKPTVPAEPSDGCPSSALSVAALRASGAAGHQYAFLQFTNTSKTTCSLTGFPGVQLLRSGAPLGKPAVRSATPASTVRMKPGGSVLAQLIDASTCDSANSDSVQVIAPNRTAKLVMPLSLRGCALSIDPVVAG